MMAKELKENSKDNFTFSLLGGLASVSISNNVPDMFTEFYDHYESNVSIFQKNYEERLGRELSFLEVNYMRNLLESLHGHMMLDVSLNLELFFYMRRAKELFDKG